MTSTGCAIVRPKLGAFIDGELSGVEMLSVSQHVEDCPVCAGEVQALRGVGSLLRDAAQFTPASPRLAGLAGGVVSRIRAEQAQSWSAMFKRSVEDWHWVFVGAGSLAAAFVSTMLVSIIVLFGPAPEREDSLQALLNNLSTPAGTLLLLTSPAGNDQESTIMQFGDGDGNSVAPATLPTQFASARLSESELVWELQASLVTPSGLVSDVRAMTNAQRARTEQILALIRSRATDTPAAPSNALTVHKVALIANTNVRPGL